MNKKSKTEIKGKKNIYGSYRGKKTKFWIPYFLGIPISPLATSFRGEFPLNEKEYLCDIILCTCMSNQITQKNRVSWEVCWGYALNHFLCMITSPDRGIPFSLSMGRLVPLLCHKLGIPSSKHQNELSYIMLHTGPIEPLFLK